MTAAVGGGGGQAEVAAVDADGVLTNHSEERLQKHRYQSMTMSAQRIVGDCVHCSQYS